MKRFCIVRNEQKDPRSLRAKRITRYLTEKGAEVKVLAADEKIDEGADCIIVLGGDGTLLRAAHRAVDSGLPLLGINLGTLGYLAEVDKNRIKPALDKLLADEFTIEKRMMLAGSVIRNNKTVCTRLALNDIVISREGPPRVIRFNNYVNNEYLNTYEADAIILSTATGSTGYSLSAGGPIISPTARMILMTPLAPHTLNARSIIFPESDSLTVEIGKSRTSRPEQARVDFDGSDGFMVETGDRIVVKKASNFTRIIKISKKSFLEVLRDKFSDD